jgi:effector-binding domain-containing protein
MMLKIGEFSKIGRVSVKTLRHYDEIGLLKPVWVDDFSSYRYYSVGQLSRLNRILALKDLGFTLEQIAPVLDENLPPAQIRGMLRLKQAEIEQRMGEEQALLARVEARLKQIEGEDTMANYDVVLKSVEPLTVASVREVLPTYGDVDRLFNELGAFVRQPGVKAIGPWFAIWHDEEYRERDVDGEAFVGLASSAPGSEKVRVYELPGVPHMASTIHKGGYHSLGDAYQAALRWIEASGCRISGPSRELYLQGPHGAGPDEYVTEIQFPVEKAP